MARNIRIDDSESDLDSPLLGLTYQDVSPLGAGVKCGSPEGMAFHDREYVLANYKRKLVLVERADYPGEYVVEFAEHDGGCHVERDNWIYPSNSEDCDGGRMYDPDDDDESMRPLAYRVVDHRYPLGVVMTNTAKRWQYVAYASRNNNMYSYGVATNLLQGTCLPHDLPQNGARIWSHRDSTVAHAISLDVYQDLLDQIDKRFGRLSDKEFTKLSNDIFGGW